MSSEDNSVERFPRGKEKGEEGIGEMRRLISDNGETKRGRRCRRAFEIRRHKVAAEQREQGGASLVRFETSQLRVAF